jgi:ornithine cyclodeaminase
VTTVLQLDEIRKLVDVTQLIEDIEAGFVLYSQGRVQVPPVGFLHFDDPPGEVHIKYGFVTGDELYVMKMASAFPDNVALGLPAGNGVILVFSQKTGALELVLLDEGWLTDIRTAAGGTATGVVATRRGLPQLHRVGKKRHSRT